MARRTEDERGDPGAPDDREESVGLVGAAVRAPLSQGRDGSFPLELEGDDLAEPHHVERVRGEPVESAVHAPTTTHIEPKPVATGECTVEVVEGEPACPDDTGGSTRH